MLSLPESPAVDTSVGDAVRADVERAGREATEGLSDVTRTAIIAAALASEAEDKSKKAPGDSTPEVVEAGGGAPEVVVAAEAGVPSMSDTLAAGVYPPEEIDTTVGTRTEVEAPATEFDGPGIDG